MNEDVTDRPVALITGANRGIGSAAARQLAGHGFTVLVGARDPQRGEGTVATVRAAGGDAHVLTLDVTDARSAQTAATYIADRFGHLDVLVNNAGITGSGTVVPTDAIDQIPSTVDVNMVRSVFETNVFGVITVTNAMLPLLRRSSAPRIVNVGSTAGSLSVAAIPDGPLSTLPESAAYTPSKSALHSLTLQYANELRNDGFLVNVADPGYVDTQINGNSGFLTPDQGAQILVQLATLGSDGPTGGFFNTDGPVPW